MINPEEFYRRLSEEGFSFFTGVPDSLLKDFCAYITDIVDARYHVITANEGGAVALATGYHLATGKAGVVYMQNSGLGNAVNPLLSLADPEVYSIPMLLLIGWRGEPGKKDEPQHVKQGRIQEPLLDTLGIPCEILDPDPREASGQVAKLTRQMRDGNRPVALLVRAGTFESCQTASSAGAPSAPYTMSRERALEIILEEISPEDRIVSTTGKTSREIYEIREIRGEDHSRDFLTVGSMGHAIMIATGLAEFQPRTVYCIDGDGAVLMHLGSLAITGSRRPERLRHIVINNGAHESVGGQPTVGFSLAFDQIAKDLGYRVHLRAEAEDDLRACVTALRNAPGPALLEVRVLQGSRPDLGRPRSSPVENKRALMDGLGIDE